MHIGQAVEESVYLKTEQLLPVNELSASQLSSDEDDLTDIKQHGGITVS